MYTLGVAASPFPVSLGTLVSFLWSLCSNSLASRRSPKPQMLRAQSSALALWGSGDVTDVSKRELVETPVVETMLRLESWDGVHQRESSSSASVQGCGLQTLHLCTLLTKTLSPTVTEHLRRLPP